MHFLTLYRVSLTQICHDQASAAKRIKKAYRVASWSEKIQVVANLEEVLELQKEKNIRTSKQHSAALAVVGTYCSSKYVWRWKRSLSGVGICDARKAVGKKLCELIPFSRETVGRKRSHIAMPKRMKHNADPVIKEHFGVLDTIFEYLTETLRVSVTYDLITEEFESELTKLGITWTKCSYDIDKDYKLKVSAVYNYLHKHKRANKRIVVYRRAKRKSHTLQEKACAVALHQQVIREAIEKHGITSYDAFYNEDETFFTKNGCMTRRSLGYRGGECHVTEPTSHKDGFMFLTTVSHLNGIVFYYFKPATETQWRNHRNRYKVEQLHPRVFSLMIHPSGKISQSTYVNVIGQIHRIVPSNEPVKLVDYDNAGPHAGKFIELSYKCLGKIPTHGPFGGGTDVDQICDDKHLHGSLKESIRKKARRKFLNECKLLHGGNKRIKPSGLNINTLALWMSQWAEEHGRPEDVHHLFQAYFPPPLGMPDLRKHEIKKHEALYVLLGDPPAKRKHVARKDMPLTALKQVGKQRATAIKELTGIDTIGSESLACIC